MVVEPYAARVGGETWWGKAGAQGWLMSLNTISGQMRDSSGDSR